METRYLLSVDDVVFGYRTNELHVLITQYQRGRLRSQYALPGDWLHPDETMEEAANRILAERTGLTSKALTQFYTFSSLDRHPEQRAISTAYWMITHCDHGPNLKNDHDVYTQWHPITKLPTLIFDHQRIIQEAREALRLAVSNRPFGKDILPATFTIGELMVFYETLLGKSLDAPNFRRKFQRNSLLTPTAEKAHSPQGRLSQLYTFNDPVYHELCDSGYSTAFSL